MNLVVISHKPCWFSLEFNNYVTNGGFPFQMEVISELFDETTLVIIESKSVSPAGTRLITGKKIKIRPLPEPMGSDFKRKMNLLRWGPKNIPIIWKKIKEADAVHAPIPGDIGAIGILISLFQKKPLFIRHCGRWDKPNTLADHFLKWLLERIAGGRNVVLATGGDSKPPSIKNQNIKWIFSTSFTEKEFSDMKLAKPWIFGDRLELITVGALTKGKNIESVIKSLPIIKEKYPDVFLNILGEGSLRTQLMKTAEELYVLDSIKFYGNVSHEQVLGYLSKSHVFIFPSFSEGFPKALIEAMACGLPVIASSISVIPNLLGNECGILLEYPNEREIAKSVIHLINDPEKIEFMGLSSRKKAEKYTLENWKHQIEIALTASWENYHKGLDSRERVESK